ERRDAAQDSGMHQQLRRIARVRREPPALQRGTQVKLLLEGETGAFYRVFEPAGVAHTAPVSLIEGDATRADAVGERARPGVWRDAFAGSRVEIRQRSERQVPAHGVRVLLRDAPVEAPALRELLLRRMEARAHGAGAETTPG